MRAPILVLFFVLSAGAAVFGEDLSVTIQNAGGTVLAAKKDPRSVQLDYAAAYQPGDVIAIAATGAKYLYVQVDAAVPESLVYAPGGRITFPIPAGTELKMGYDPAAFGGASHVIKARLALPGELTAERNVAFDAADKRGQTEYFPHASANIVTRNEADFYERNTIDGNANNAHHGSWPYESWSGGAREDLTYQLDFGREVEVNKVRFFLRCDFPHDTYWKSLRINFSDGSHLDVPLEKTAAPQEVSFPPKKIVWLRLNDFKQATSPLSWAGLTELEVIGHDLASHP